MLPGLRRLVLLALALASGCAHRPPGPAAGELRIYLARHGQTDWNAESRLQGWVDTHLNATGREQAVRLGERLEGIRLDTVYSSALARSRETAEIVHGAVPIDSLPGLNERRLGKYEGVVVGGPASDSATVAEFNRRVRDPGDALDGGETLEHFYERVRATVEEIRRRHRVGTILIVAHGGTNQMVLRALLGLTAGQASNISQANDELYLIEVSGGRPPALWKLITEKNLGDL